MAKEEKIILHNIEGMARKSGTDDEDLLQCAIREAEERTRKWIVPCRWEARILIRGNWETVCRVTRYHR